MHHAPHCQRGNVDENAVIGAFCNDRVIDHGLLIIHLLLEKTKFFDFNQLARRVIGYLLPLGCE